LAASRQASSEPASAAYLKIVVWLAMIFLPWAAIAYVVHIAAEF
jgi:hypothetical protein